MSAQQTLPRLATLRQVMDECDCSRATAEAIMRRCRKVEIPGYRRLLVRREDIAQALEQWSKEA